VLHNGDSVKPQVLLPAEVPLIFKRNLTTVESEPLFELRDFRTVSTAATPEKPQARKRAQTVSSPPTKQALGLEVPVIPARHSSDTAESHPPSRPLSFPATSTEIGEESLNFRYQETRCELVVGANDTMEAVLKACFSRFGISEAPDHPTNYALFFVQGQKDRALKAGEKVLLVKVKAQQFSPLPILFEVRDRRAELQLLEDAKTRAPTSSVISPATFRRP